MLKAPGRLAVFVKARTLRKRGYENRSRPCRGGFALLVVPIGLWELCAWAFSVKATKKPPEGGLNIWSRGLDLNQRPPGYEP